MGRIQIDSWYSQEWASQVGLVVKNPPANAGHSGLIPGWGKSAGGGYGNPLQYFCLENAMDRGAWRTMVHGVPKSRTHLKQLSTYAHLHSQKWLPAALLFEPRDPREPGQNSRSLRWGSKIFYTESGKKPSQELVDLEVNTLTPQVPSRPGSSLSSFVSVLKCHLILWASYPEDSGEKSTLPHTLFSLPSFSPQQFSALICYIFICTCMVCLLSPEHVALGAGTLTLFISGPQ